MIYPTAMPQGYPQQPNFSMPIHSNSIYFPQMPLQQQPPPDQMLMNLGFADDVDNFLPARFAQDWNLSIDQTMPAWLFFCRVENLMTTT
jgi:hypothetical protein